MVPFPTVWSSKMDETILKITLASSDAIFLPGRLLSQTPTGHGTSDSSFLFILLVVNSLCAQLTERLEEVSLFGCVTLVE